MDNIKRKNNYFDGMQLTRDHKLVFIFVMSAFFFEQFDNTNFGFVAPALIKSWGVTMDVIPQITSWYFIGMMLGALLGGLVSDKIGRKKTFLGSVLLFSLGSFLNALPGTSLNFFIIARALTGFGVFAMMVVSITYISEMAPAEVRGKWQGLVAMCGLFSVPLVGLISRFVIPLSPDAWRILFYIGALGIIPFIIGIFTMKESPRWLVSKGRIAEAEKIVEEISKQKIDLSDLTIAPKESVWENIIELFKLQYIKRTVMLLIALTCITIAMMSMSNWTPTLLTAKGFSLTAALSITTIGIFAPPFGGLLNTLTSDKGGRKIPLIIYAFSTAVFILLFANLTTNSILIIGIVYFAQGGLMTCLCNALYSYQAESYPTRMRNTATGGINAVARFFTAVFQPLIPLVFTAYKFSGVFTLFAGLMFVTGLSILLLGTKTGGRSLEDIT
ncbi:MFS transporter [Desulfitobacterium sp. THU1]|uniref:MFS transporter n=1 Tax=Desulfitobacterium sp. THU1 TaxID=3138072 RepID=UPI00311DDC04